MRHFVKHTVCISQNENEKKALLHESTKKLHPRQTPHLRTLQLNIK
jgi:hypothetical protein